jgi:two-component system, NarL family, nitrate/nitrite response regulator NarL
MGKTRKRIVIEKSLAGSPAIHDLARHPQLAGRITVCERAEVQAMVAWGDVDLVVLDADGDLAGALDLVVRVHSAPAHARALLLRTAPTSDFSEEAILTGAAGIIAKGEPTPVMLKALTCIRRGELWVDRKTTGRVFERLVRSRVAKKNDAVTYADLTRREVAIIGHVVRHPGAPNRMLAASLNISQNTLRNHLHTIYAKLRIRRRVELAIFAH